MPSPSDEITTEIAGTWDLVSFTVDGAPETVKVGVNALTQPSVTFDGRRMLGDGGCNEFGDIGDENYRYSEGQLSIIELAKTDMACPDHNATETAFLGMLWDEEAEIRVEVEADTMTWRAGGEVLLFVRADPDGDPETELMRG